MNDTTGATNASSTEFDGQCAFAVSVGKLGVPGAPKHRVVTDGQTYLFKNGVARMLWRAFPGRQARAREVWNART